MTQVCCKISHNLHAEELGFFVSPFELIKEPANGGHPYPELPELSPDPGQNQISFQVLDVVRDVGVVDGDDVIVIVFGVGDATISPAPDLSLMLLVLTFCVFRVRTITMKICLGAKNNTGRGRVHSDEQKLSCYECIL